MKKIDPIIDTSKGYIDIKLVAEPLPTTYNEDGSVSVLSPAQQELMAAYRDYGIRVGKSTDDGRDLMPELLALVPEVYREAGYAPVKPDMIFLVDSPKAAIEKYRELTGLADSPPVFEGCIEIHWLVNYMFCEEVLGIKEASRVRALRNLASISHWTVFLDEACIISRRPVSYSWEEVSGGIQGASSDAGTESDRPPRLHNMNGPAILYRDGYRINAIGGVVVEDVIVDTPADQLDPDLFFREQNAERRMAIGAKIGMENLLDRLPHTELDSIKLGDYDPILTDLQFRVTLRDQGQPHEEIPSWALNADGSLNLDAKCYRLVRVVLPEVGATRWLVMGNPSESKIHCEGVTPDCATVRQALAFRAGLTEEIYLNPQVVV